MITVDELPPSPEMGVLLIGNEEGDEGSVTATQDSQVEAT